jgi:hypothetical protein
MKRLFKGLSVIILLSALVGAGILVKENQETRRGATMAETSISVLPDSLKVEKGKEFTLSIWANTGKVEDKMAGMEMGIKYDAKVNSYVSAEIQSGYTLLDEGSEGAGYRWFKIVGMGEEKSGAFPILKINFKALSDGTDSIMVAPGAKMMITGQSSLWTVAKAFSSKVVVGKGGTTTALNCDWCGNSCIDVNPKMMCPQVMPPAGQSCVNVDNKCVVQKKGVAGEGEMCGGIKGIMCDTGLTCKYGKTGDTRNLGKPIVADETGICVKETEVKPTPTGVTGLSCGQRCGGSTGCGAGLTCMPIWWPCETPIPDPIWRKMSANMELDKAMMEEVLRICPAAQKVLSPSYMTDASGVKKEIVKAPPFYGVCKNPSCPTSGDCVCKPRPTITGKLKSDLSIRETFEKNGVFVLGENATVGIDFNVPPQNGLTVPGRVSAINATISFDKNLLEALEVTMVDMSFNNVIKKEIDNEKGLIWLYVTSSKPYSELSAGITLGSITFKTKAEGKAMIGISLAHPLEMSGVDNDRKTVSYDVTVSPIKYVTIGPKVSACAACMSGLARSTGNANCDGAVNSVDFEIWRSEMFDKGGLVGTTSSTWQADFNCDQKVSGTDFEIWRKTVFQ